MLRNLFLKELRDRRWAMMWWSIGIVAFTIMQIAFYPSIQGNASIQEYMDQAPEWIKLFVGENLDIQSAVGYLNSQFFFLMLPALFLILSILLGSDALAGEEGRGTMDLLLSAPLRRRRVVLEKCAVLVAVVIAVAGAFYASMALSAVIVGMDISYLHAAEATFDAVLLALVFGILALLAGAGSGSRGMAGAVAGALALAAYLLNSLVPMVKALKPWSRLSPFYYYAASNPLAKGLNWLHVMVLVASAAVLLAATLVVFDRRDVAV